MIFIIKKVARRILKVIETYRFIAETRCCIQKIKETGKKGESLPDELLEKIYAVTIRAERKNFLEIILNTNECWHLKKQQIISLLRCCLVNCYLTSISYILQQKLWNVCSIIIVMFFFGSQIESFLRQCYPQIQIDLIDKVPSWVFIAIISQIICLLITKVFLDFYLQKTLNKNN